MKVRILGAATGPAELERDGLHAIYGCFVPSVTYFSYWLSLSVWSATKVKRI